MRISLIPRVLLLAYAILLASSAVLGGDVKVVSVKRPADCDSLPKAALGKWLLVHFSAVVDESSDAGTPGEVFQNSKDVGLPIVVRLEPDQVIPGWVDGLEGVCAQSEVVLVVPPEKGYGDDLTVRFEIEILQVSDSEIDEPSLFDVLDEDKDGQISVEEFEKHFKTRKAELDAAGKAPMGLFLKDDVNQNSKLNWEEFSGPKGTQPPAVAEAIIAREKKDPILSAHKKGDPIKININVHGEGDEALGDDSPATEIFRANLDEL